MSCGSLDEEECLALCDEEGCSIVAPTSFMRTLKLGMYFVLWFALSTGYNIENKASIRSSSSLSDCLRGARAARSPDGWLLLRCASTRSRCRGSSRLAACSPAPCSSSRCGSPVSGSRLSSQVRLPP